MGVLPRHSLGWLLLASLVLQSTVFLGMNLQNIDFWPLSFIYLAPWSLAVTLHPRARRVVVASYGLGALFYWVNGYYLWALTKPGYVALGLYFGLYYGVCAIVMRALYRRWHAPLTIAVPVAWVASEFLRSIGPLAWPFLFAGHGVYKQLALIQLSDLTGVAGVSFVIAMTNGLVADLVAAWLHRRCGLTVHRRLFIPVLFTLLVLAGTLLYGVIQLERSALRPGPRVAVLQGDYPLFVDDSRPAATDLQKATAYMDLLSRAALDDPDLILLPETPWHMYLNEEFLKAPDVPPLYRKVQEWSVLWDEKIGQRAVQSGAYIVTGASSIEFFPTAVYPTQKKYNSAFVYPPDGGPKQRYNKVALVMFGEYTPFRYGRLHAVYRWLDSFNPFSEPNDEFSLTAGDAFDTFEINTAGSRYRFGIPICFEDLIPRVSREFALDDHGRKESDFLLSISNDGWFNHGALVPQHLAVCAFRAVENRIGIARSVNTSCSGFVDPDGRIHDLVNDRGRTLGRNLFGYSVAQVMIDPRVTVYSRWGDWFGAACTILAGLAWLGSLAMGRRDRSSAVTPA